MTTEKPYDLVGLGVCTLDVLMRVPAFPGEIETVQAASEHALQGGGPVATALAVAARLGARPLMIDRLGDDWRAGRILAEFCALGVETASILQEPGATSSLATVWVREKDGARSIAYAPGTARELSGTDLAGGWIEQAKILHVNGRHPSALPAAFARAKAAGTRISFDGGAGRFREALREPLLQVDLAIVAREFAISWTGQRDPEAAAESILKSGASLAVITAGLEGSWIFPALGPAFHQPAFPVSPVVDTTGCGDVYHGAFLTGLAADWPLPECARIASAAAALNAMALGGRGHLPTLEVAQALADGGGGR